jgi:hypothetical protein
MGSFAQIEYWADNSHLFRKRFGSKSRSFGPKNPWWYQGDSPNYVIVFCKHLVVIWLGVPLRVGLSAASPHCVPGFPLLSLTRHPTHSRCTVQTEPLNPYSCISLIATIMLVFVISWNLLITLCYFLNLILTNLCNFGLKFHGYG